MRWARRATLILGAAHAMATALFLTLVITHAAHTGSWRATIRFNDYSEGVLELVAAWALLPALAWMIHTALKHEIERESPGDGDARGSRPTPQISPRSLKAPTDRSVDPTSTLDRQKPSSRYAQPPTPPTEADQ